MRSKFNTAWFLVLVLAIASVVVVVQAYQNAHHPPSTPPVFPKSPRMKQYEQAVVPWREKLAAQNLVLTWPYLNNDYAARLDLPALQPIILAAWDAPSENKVAGEAYKSFVQVREHAKVGNPGACLIHVFDASGVEVAQASASGVENAASAPLEPQ